MYLYERMNRVAAHCGLASIMPPDSMSGNHRRLDMFDTVLGIDTTGGRTRKVHFSPRLIPANPVGARLALHEQYLARHFDSMESETPFAFWLGAPTVTPHGFFFWLGANR